MQMPDIVHVRRRPHQALLEDAGGGRLGGRKQCEDLKRFRNNSVRYSKGPPRFAVDINPYEAK